jgi:hypothetical protein
LMKLRALLDQVSEDGHRHCEREARQAHSEISRWSSYGSR